MKFVTAVAEIEKLPTGTYYSVCIKRHPWTFLLRKTGPNNWVRVDSLVAGKDMRYADWELIAMEAGVVS